MVENRENVTPDSKKYKRQNKKGKKKIDPIVSVVIPLEAVICSICAQIIPDYVPEYFGRE